MVKERGYIKESGVRKISVLRRFYLFIFIFIFYFLFSCGFILPLVTFFGCFCFDLIPRFDVFYYELA